jgi:hypothetical protein
VGPPIRCLLDPPVNDAELDGEIYEDAYLAPLNPDSEIYVIPKIGGG